MTIHLSIPRQQQPELNNVTRPRIGVIGVGGAGGNAINNMVLRGLEGVHFVAANTDAQALATSKAGQLIQLGPRLTEGLGAGSAPETGRRAAEEVLDDIHQWLQGLHMLFIAAGMGGGTGTGAAPVVARAAREHKLLTVAVVTKPFDFEGGRRMRCAEEGVAGLEPYTDTLIVTSNQKLFRIADRETSISDAFSMADQVLHHGVRGVIDLIIRPGLINLDFADIRAMMSSMGKAQMGSGEAEGDGRAIKAAEAAIANPLLEEGSIAGAGGVLVNITGGQDVGLMEVEEAVQRVRSESGERANVVFGVAVDDTMNGRMRVSVLAAGIAPLTGEGEGDFSQSAALLGDRQRPNGEPQGDEAAAAASAASAHSNGSNGSHGERSDGFLRRLFGRRQRPTAHDAHDHGNGAHGAGAGAGGRRTPLFGQLPEERGADDDADDDHDVHDVPLPEGGIPLTKPAYLRRSPN